MICTKCGKEIATKPCPYCGSENDTLNIFSVDDITVDDDIKPVVIGGSSEAIVERGKDVQTFRFDPGVSSGEIVNASLHSSQLGELPFRAVRNQITYNINRIETYAESSPTGDITHEHSFELNLGFFKYKYKRTTKS